MRVQPKACFLLGCTAIPLILTACDAGRPVSDRPVSYSAMRFDATVPQRQDFTCGAASLATLLTYYWARPTTESMLLAVLKGRYSVQEIESIGEHGLSFDDLIFMAGALGFSAEGARIEQDQLEKLAGPVIIHLDKGSFQHFAVLRRVGQGVYYVSDPAIGQLAMSRPEFTAQYTGEVLAVWKAGSPLPAGSALTNPRDGVRVGDSLRRIINMPDTAFQRGA